jgi:ferredoxin-nitrite reductase
MNGDFTLEQKRYLEGFASGLQIARGSRGAAAFPVATVSSADSPAAVLGGPEAAHLAAMARFESDGKKLSDPEKWKREHYPLDAYAKLEEQAAKDEFPKPPDNFRWRFFGLFYAGPAQDAYMCRLRIPNGILKHWQFAGLADIADRHAGRYAHVTTRANLQIREIAAKNATEVLAEVRDLGLCSRGSGADNIRNITGDATAGLAAGELLDTRRYARALHFHILNDRSLYGLPRKFNIAFDGGGPIPTLEETNDVGFQAVEILTGASVPPGVYFRLVLGGVTGHKDIARETGVVVSCADAVKVADAIVRVFIDSGDRTNRAKARLKYVLDAWGTDKFLGAVEARLDRALPRVAADHVAPRPLQDRQAHIGVHRQKQEGLSYIGVVLPVGKMTTEQMRALACMAHDCGDGDMRLTVWQNLLLSGITDAKLDEAKQRITACGLEWKTSSLRAGLVACTGSKGCKFAASDTKGQAEKIAAWCEKRVQLDQPVNIHLTGCHHSCAQHYIGDIGLIGARVAVNDEGDTVDGYHMVIGGGFGRHAAIGREIFRDVKADEVPQRVETLLRAYLVNRTSPEESFHDFTSRHEIDALQRFGEEIES